MSDILIITSIPMQYRKLELLKYFKFKLYLEKDNLPWEFKISFNTNY